MHQTPEFEAIIKNCDKQRIVNFLKTIFPGKGGASTKFGGTEQGAADGITILGSVTLLTGDGRPKPVLCCAKQMDGMLTERSSRRRQFDTAVKILKGQLSTRYSGNGTTPVPFTQGLFFFFDEPGNFRLSLVTAEISAGKMELNNYRRQSFFVEAGKNNKTFRTRLCKTIANYDELKSAFDVEKLSDEFFREYKVFYEDIVQYITGARYIEVKKNKYERKDMSGVNHEIYDQFEQAYGEGAERAVRNYVKKLMGRLVFIQFLQKKGWLGNPMGSNTWNSGDRDFMQSLFLEVPPEDRENFIDNILEEIFFGEFNTKENERHIKNATLKKYRFPFLNCGLFDRDTDDKLDFKLPAAVFCNLKYSDTERKAPNIKDWSKKRNPYFDDRACGLFDFFDRFNFTIDENDPTDAEVSVDPEMLGKIFENLLEENKDKGAFYTPKEIVNYMVNESLIAYLETETSLRAKGEAIQMENAKVIEPAEMTASRIRNFVLTQDSSAFSATEKMQLDTKLAEVKICDPAIGSGAFPMGLLNLLCKCRQSLQPVEKQHDKKTIAALKRDIIQQNIYGVDIEKGAVDIARLRFWLSLIVDEDTPEVLPNLEFKIMQGNSLLESYEDIDLSGLAGEKGARTRAQSKDQLSLVFDEKQAMEQIQKDLNKFYKTDSHTEKESLTLSINNNVREYIKYIAPQKSREIDAMPVPNDKFFLWHTYFRDVFNRKGKEGFDIVIGNPPYIQLQTMGAISDTYKNEAFETFNKTGDIYCLFVEQGMDLLCKDGVLTYIMPNKWMQAGYGKELRLYLSKKRILNFVDFGDYQIFANATTYVCIPLLQNAKPLTKFKASYMKDADMSKIPERSDCFDTADFGEESWVLSSSAEKKLRDRIEKTFPRLKKFVGGEAYYGIKTGLTKAFLIDEATKNDLILKDKRAQKIIHPVLRGRDMFPYQNPEIGAYLIGTFPARNLNIDDYPSVKNWLMSFGKERLEQTGKTYKVGNEIIKARKKTTNKWFETQDQISYYAEFAKPKIMYQRFQVKPCFVYDERGLFCNDSIWVLATDNKALLGLLNSKMGWWLISKYCTQIQNGYQLIWKYFGEIPIALAENEKSKKIAEKVELILEAKKKDPAAKTSKLEDEIDDIIYDLYDLLPEEIAIVKGASSAQKDEEKKTHNDKSSKAQGSAASDNFFQGEDL